MKHNPSEDIVTTIRSYDAIAHGYMFWRQRPWRIVDVVRGETILDIGSGPCVNGAYAALKNSGYVVCLDLSKSMAYAAKATLKKLNVLGDTVNADALLLPFRENSFDAVVAIAVVHHIPKQ